MSAPQSAADEITSTLRWVQPRRFRRAYELRDDGRTIGDLTWSGALGKSAGGGVGGQRWMFEPRHWLSSDILVIRSRSGELVGVLRWSCWRATFRPTPGQVVTWKTARFFSGVWGFFDEAGHPIVTFAPERKWFGVEAVVRIHASPEKPADCPLLLLLGWYLMVLEETTNRD